MNLGSLGRRCVVASFVLSLSLLPLKAQMQSAAEESGGSPKVVAASISSELAGDRPDTGTTGTVSSLPNSPIPIPSGVVRNSNEPVLEHAKLPKKMFFSLALLQHGAVAYDSWSTRRLIDAGGRELDPLVKPVASSNALYPVMQTWPLAIDYIAARMARSDRPWMRKMWWLPQTVSAVSSIVIASRNVSLGNAAMTSGK